MKKILVGITFVALILVAAWPLLAQEEVQEAGPNPVGETKESLPTLYEHEQVSDPDDPNLRFCREGGRFIPCREIEGWTPDDPRQTFPPPIDSKEFEMGREAREAKARAVLPACPENPSRNLEEGFCIDSEGWVYSAHYRGQCADAATWGICADGNGKLGRGDRLPNGIEPP